MKKILRVIIAAKVPLLFIDVYNVHTGIQRLYSWAQRNEEASIFTQPRSKTIHAIVALTSSNLFLL
jgi:hypothetical protein